MADGGVRVAWRRPFLGKPTAHFLHIGKTGGTAVKEALEPHRRRGTYRIVLEPHRVTLDDLPADDVFFFFVRDPVTRFASGFVSRQRQGAPRHHYPWNRAEREAFGHFTTANELAEALSSDDAAEVEAAAAAMRGIRHVKASYWSWFGDEQRLRANAHRLLFCGAQETLDTDFALLLDLLGLDARRVQLPTDDVRAHRRPKGTTGSLSSTAVANLERWYAADFRFLDVCEELVPSFTAPEARGPSSEPATDL